MLKLSAVALAAATLSATVAFAQPYQSYQYYQYYQYSNVPCDRTHDSWHDGMHCNIGPQSPAERSPSGRANRAAPNGYGAYGSYAGQ